MGGMTRDDGYTRYTIRIPTPLYERVKAAAGEASVNSLVVATLEEAYPPPETFNPFAFIMEEWSSKAATLSPAERRDLLENINARLEAEGVDYLRLTLDEDKVSVTINTR